MISTNALSVFILHHNLNGLGNKNLCSIQDVTHISEPVARKYKRVCEDFPNIAILTKSATPGEIQLTFVHAAVGNKSLGGSFVAFSLAEDLSSPSVIYLKIKIAFAADGNKICLPIRKSSFVPLLATSRARRSRGTGLRTTPSSSRHFLRRPQYYTGSRTRASS